MRGPHWARQQSLAVALEKKNILNNFNGSVNNTSDKTFDLTNSKNLNIQKDCKVGCVVEHVLL